MEAKLRCKVFPGQFSTELAIEGVQSDGAKFSLFAPVALVTPDEAPTRDRSVDGWLQVSVWEEEGATTLIKLPRESFEVGRFATVNSADLQVEREPVKA
jgi:hypothetical protein